MEEARPETASTFTLPLTESDIVATAESHGLSIPHACMPGLVANLTLLASHAECLLGGNRTS